MSVMAAILVIVSYNMSQWRTFRSMLRSPRSDQIILLTTFFLTVFVSLSVAIEVGVVLAALLFMKTMAEVTNVNIVTKNINDDDADDGITHHYDLPEGVELYEINGPFFFGAAEKFTETIRSTGKLPKILLLRMRNVPAIDATGLIVLEGIHKELISSGGMLIIADIHSQPYLTLKTSGLLAKIGDGNIFTNMNDALARIQVLSD